LHVDLDGVIDGQVADPTTEGDPGELGLPLEYRQGVVIDPDLDLGPAVSGRPHVSTSP